MMEARSTCLIYLAPCHQEMQKVVTITLFNMNQNLLSISLRRRFLISLGFFDFHSCFVNIINL